MALVNLIDTRGRRIVIGTELLSIESEEPPTDDTFNFIVSLVSLDASHTPPDVPDGIQITLVDVTP